MSLAETRFELAEEMYRSKIKTFARGTYGTIPGFQCEDMEAEILEVLWLCVKNYDPNKGARFSTFFWTAAKHKLTHLYRLKDAKKRNAEVVYIDPDALINIIDGCYEIFSAEDWAVALMSVEQRVAG